MHILGVVLYLPCCCASLGAHMEIIGAAWWVAENRASLWQIEQISQLRFLKLNSLSILPKPTKLVPWMLQILVPLLAHGMNIYLYITPFRTRQWNTASLMNHPAFLKGCDLPKIKSNQWCKFQFASQISTYFAGNSWSTLGLDMHCCVFSHN